MRLDNGQWLCECGAPIPPALPPGSHRTSAAGVRVQCPNCGAWYEYNYWALNRWPGDKGNTGLEPRRATMS